MKSKQVVWEPAGDIQIRISELVKTLEMDWISDGQIYTYRSQNAKTRAYARIWGLSRIFQLALKIPPSYVIEVISEKFDKLGKSRQDEILIHELVHIPKTFSGALTPHYKRRRGKRLNRPGFEDRVHELVGKYAKQ